VHNHVPVTPIDSQWVVESVAVDKDRSGMALQIKHFNLQTKHGSILRCVTDDQSAVAAEPTGM
jgi:hypothetical protein